MIVRRDEQQMLEFRERWPGDILQFNDCIENEVKSSFSPFHREHSDIQQAIPIFGNRQIEQATRENRKQKKQTNISVRSESEPETA